jgi:hypothetical protein
VYNDEVIIIQQCFNFELLHPDRLKRCSRGWLNCIERLKRDGKGVRNFCRRKKRRFAM